MRLTNLDYSPHNKSPTIFLPSPHPSLNFSTPHIAAGSVIFTRAACHFTDPSVEISPGAPVSTHFTPCSGSARTASHSPSPYPQEPTPYLPLHASSILHPSRAPSRLLIRSFLQRAPIRDQRRHPSDRASHRISHAQRLSTHPQPTTQVSNECIHLERAKPRHRRFLDRCRREQLLCRIVRQRGRWIGSAHCPQLLRQRDPEELFSYDRV